MRLTVIFILSISFSSFGQGLSKDAKKIVEEGKMLYRSEMAAWYGTDLFVAAYEDRANIGGYFAYPDEDSTKCVFVSRSDSTKIIGTVALDSTFSVKTANLSLTERNFTTNELDYYLLRERALDRIRADSMFVMYNNTNFNIIPIISGKERKVYVLSGPTLSGVVIFGNDYLIEFNAKNKIKSAQVLHANIIPMEYGNEENEVGSMHSHTKKTGDYITATDICTLMLYAKYAGWDEHIVVSEKYMNRWDCKTNSLIVLPVGSFKKIQEDQEKRENIKD